MVMESPRHKVVEHVCYNCDYEWKSRVPNPRKCPNCQSRKWNMPPVKVEISHDGRVVVG